MYLQSLGGDLGYALVLNGFEGVWYVYRLLDRNGHLWTSRSARANADWPCDAPANTTIS